MSYTRRQFSNDVIKALGNNKPDKYVVDFVVAWSVWETAAGQSATFNLLNTTQPMPGATNYNAIGVKNYVTYAQGIDATIKTLQNGLYNSLVKALKNNESLRLASRDGAIDQELNTWSGGAGYYQKILTVAQGIHNGRDNRGNDVFGGNATAIGITSTLNLPTVNRKLRISQIKPDASVAEVLEDIDVLMAVSNPFDIRNAQKKNVFGTTITDPTSWLSEFGLNMAENSIAVWLRVILLLLGIVIFWKGIKNGLGIDPMSWTPLGQLLGGDKDG